MDSSGERLLCGRQDLVKDREGEWAEEEWTGVEEKAEVGKEDRSPDTNVVLWSSLLSSQTHLVLLVSC